MNERGRVLRVEQQYNGPGLLPRTARIGISLFTGQMLSSVLPTATCTPLQKGFVFDALRVNWIIVGFLLSSVAMSFMVIWEEGSNIERERIMSSPEWKKPKKQQQHIAQSIM